MQSFAQLKEKVNKLLNEKTLSSRFPRTDHNSLIIIERLLQVGALLTRLV